MKEQLILELQEMIRILHVVPLPIDFNLLCVLGQELGVLKILLFKIFIAFRAFSQTFGGRLGLYCGKYDWFGQNFPFCFCFDAFMLLYVLEIFQIWKYCEYRIPKSNPEFRIQNTQLERMYQIQFRQMMQILQYYYSTRYLLVLNILWFTKIMKKLSHFVSCFQNECIYKTFECN